MAEGANEAAWNHTSHLMALTASIHRDPKRQKPFKPEDFNPYARKEKRVDGTVSVAALKDVLMGAAKKNSLL